MRSAILNLMLFLLSAVLSLVCTELAVRGFLGDGPMLVRLFEPDRALLYRNQPGFDATVGIPQRNREHPVPVPIVISSQGLRDRVYATKGPDEFRILMLGDSFTFGWGLPESASIPRQLEARLSSRYPNRVIGVVNGGVPGYGPWQSQRQFLQLTGELNPDLVIYQSFTANDLADTLVQFPETLDALNANRPKRLRLVRRLRLQDHAIARVDQWLYGHAWIYYYGSEAWGDDLLLTHAYNRIGIGPSVPIPEVPHSVNRPFVYEPDLCKNYPQLERAWEYFENDIRALQDACKQRGIGFMAYNIPYPFDVNMVYTHFARFPHGTYSLDQGNQRTESFFGEAGIPYAPMLNAFRTHSAPESLYFPANEHLNEAGVRLTVETLVERFFKDGLGGTAQEVALPPEASATAAWKRTWPYQMDHLLRG